MGDAAVAPAGQDALQCFPLACLKLGSQSAKGSILSVHVAHSLDQLVFFVDNSPWSKVFPRSRSAQLLNMLINKSLKRHSPFANRSKMARLCQELTALEEEEFRKSAADSGVASTGPGQGRSSLSHLHSHSHSQAQAQHPLSYTHPHLHSHSHSHSHKPSTPRAVRSLSTKGGGVHKKLKWQTVTSLVRRLQAKKRALSRLHPPPRGLCGCVTFEVQWKHVHGILYQNFLQVDTLMALEASCVVKREFDTAAQAKAWHTARLASSCHVSEPATSQSRDMNAGATVTPADTAGDDGTPGVGQRTWESSEGEEEVEMGWNQGESGGRGLQWRYTSGTPGPAHCTDPAGLRRQASLTRLRQRLSRMGGDPAAEGGGESREGEAARAFGRHEEREEGEEEQEEGKGKERWGRWDRGWNGSEPKEAFGHERYGTPREAFPTGEGTRERRPLRTPEGVESMPGVAELPAHDAELAPVDPEISTPLVRRTLHFQPDFDEVETARGGSPCGTASAQSSSEALAQEAVIREWALGRASDGREARGPRDGELSRVLEAEELDVETVDEYLGVVHVDESVWQVDLSEEGEERGAEGREDAEEDSEEGEEEEEEEAEESATEEGEDEASVEESEREEGEEKEEGAGQGAEEDADGVHWVEGSEGEQGDAEWEEREVDSDTDAWSMASDANSYVRILDQEGGSMGGEANANLEPPSCNQGQGLEDGAAERLTLLAHAQEEGKAVGRSRHDQEGRDGGGAGAARDSGIAERKEGTLLGRHRDEQGIQMGVEGVEAEGKGEMEALSSVQGEDKEWEECVEDADALLLPVAHQGSSSPVLPKCMGHDPLLPVPLGGSSSPVLPHPNQSQGTGLCAKEEGAGVPSSRQSQDSSGGMSVWSSHSDTSLDEVHARPPSAANAAEAPASAAAVPAAAALPEASAAAPPAAATPAAAAASVPSASPAAPAQEARATPAPAEMPELQPPGLLGVCTQKLAPLPPATSGTLSDSYWEAPTASLTTSHRDPPSGPPSESCQEATSACVSTSHRDHSSGTPSDSYLEATNGTIGGSTMDAAAGPGRHRKPLTGGNFGSGTPSSAVCAEASSNAGSTCYLDAHATCGEEDCAAHTWRGSSSQDSQPLQLSRDSERSTAGTPAPRAQPAKATGVRVTGPRASGGETRVHFQDWGMRGSGAPSLGTPASAPQQQRQEGQPAVVLPGSTSPVRASPAPSSATFLVHNSTPVQCAQLHGAPLYSTLHDSQLHSILVRNTPVHGMPVNSTPSHGAPVHSTPVHSTPVEHPATLGPLPEPQVVEYHNCLVFFRFSDPLLPQELKRAVLKDQRLLHLVEAGLPAWAILWQTIPGVSQAYRPWVRHAAMYGYVLISLVTALIGLYDLYKNVPVLRETLARALEPILRALGSCDMATRLKYLGTIVFLQNCQRAFSYLLHVGMLMGKAATWLHQSFLPLLAPLLAPWRLLVGLSSALGSALGWVCSGTAMYLGHSLWGLGVLVAALMQLLTSVMLAPCLASLVLITNTGAALLTPVWQALTLSVAICVRPVVQAAILILHSASFLLNQLSRALTPLLQAGAFTPWRALGAPVSAVSRAASSRGGRAALGATREVLLIPSSLQRLLRDLFSKVFRAVRGIVAGLMAFIDPCIRHRTSLYRRAVRYCHRLRTQMQQGLVTPVKRFHRAVVGGAPLTEGPRRQLAAPLPAGRPLGASSAPGKHPRRTPGSTGKDLGLAWSARHAGLGPRAAHHRYTLGPSVGTTESMLYHGLSPRAERQGLYSSRRDGLVYPGQGSSSPAPTPRAAEQGPSGELLTGIGGIDIPDGTLGTTAAPRGEYADGLRATGTAGVARGLGHVKGGSGTDSAGSFVTPNSYHAPGLRASGVISDTVGAGGDAGADATNRSTVGLGSGASGAAKRASPRLRREGLNPRRRRASTPVQVRHAAGPVAPICLPLATTPVTDPGSHRQVEEAGTHPFPPAQDSPPSSLESNRASQEEAASRPLTHSESSAESSAAVTLAERHGLPGRAGIGGGVKGWASGAKEMGSSHPRTCHTGSGLTEYVDRLCTPCALGPGCPSCEARVHQGCAGEGQHHGEGQQIDCGEGHHIESGERRQIDGGERSQVESGGGGAEKPSGGGLEEEEDEDAVFVEAPVALSGG